MLSEDPKHAVAEEIHHLIRPQTKTLAACDFKKPTLMPIRIRASTYSCSRPFQRNSLVVDLEEMRKYLLSGYVGERRRASFRCHGAGSAGYASGWAFGKIPWQKESGQRGQRFYPANVMVDEESEDFMRPICNSIGSYRRPLRVKVLGCESIDKSVIIKQIATSECNGLQDTTKKNNFTTVPLNLDGEDSVVELEEVQFCKAYRHTFYVDAFIMMYSIDDRASFEYVLREVSRLRETLDMDQPIIMVANNSSQIRNRIVSAKEGKAAAAFHDCKHMEMPDFNRQLLVPIVRQIRHTNSNAFTTNKCGKVTRHRPRKFFKARTLLQRLFGRKSKSGF